MEKRYGPFVVRPAKRMRLMNTMRPLTEEEAPIYMESRIRTDDIIEVHYAPGHDDHLPTVEYLRRLRYDLMRDYWPARDIEVHLHLPAIVDGMTIFAW